MPTPPKAIRGGWVRPLYLYAVSLVSLVVFIIGTTMILNLVIRRYVFGLSTEWYNPPRYACEYILTQEKLPPEYAADPGSPRGKPAMPVALDEQGMTVPTPEERQLRYDRCIARQTEEQEMQAAYDFARTISNGTAMILVAVPLFFFHWALIRRDRKKTA